MLTIKTLTVKNFLSVGNQTQAINFEGKHLVLVIGENIDMGGDDAGARNGTGKTTIINAISYALYGEALTQIRKDNLVNKTNNKDMLVSITFEKNGTVYTIERGRKPATLKFFINDVEQEDQSNEAQGENRETQHEIDKLIGMSHAMFKNIVALNTYTQPFLATKQGEQREIIEQLLGITILSEKAELLKEQMRGNKDELISEKYRLDSAVASNEKIEESIKTIKLRSTAWQTQKETDIANFQQAITELEKVDIKKEMDAHKQLARHTENTRALASLQKEKAYHEDSLTKAESQSQTAEKDLEFAKDARCPTCEQPLLDDKHEHLVTKLKTTLTESTRLCG
jgi:DNA repair exonuclease SbcCD ATPase subunit